MRPTLCLIAALMLCSVGPPAAAAQAPDPPFRALTPMPELSGEDLADITRHVATWRSATIGPGSRYDWCAVPEFFGNDGALLGGEEARTAIATTRQGCAARDTAKDKPRPGSVVVQVSRMDRFKDSVVVRTFANYVGMSVCEQYVLSRNRFSD